MANDNSKKPIQQPVIPPTPKQEPKPQAINERTWEKAQNRFDFQDTSSPIKKGVDSNALSGGASED